MPKRKTPAPPQYPCERCEAPPPTFRHEDRHYCTTCFEHLVILTDLPCECGAASREPCRTASGKARTQVHKSRADATAQRRLTEREQRRHKRQQRLQAAMSR